MFPNGLNDDRTTLLLREFTHRVMNSFQIITSLCASLANETHLPVIRCGLDNLAGRTAALANLNRAFSDFSSDCHLHSRLDQICGDLLCAFDRNDVEIISEVDDCLLTAPQRAGLQMIVAELVMNCLKHGLAHVSRGRVWITVKAIDSGAFVEVFDSGTEPSEGHTAPVVVLALAQNLGGDATVVDRNGYAVRVTLPYTRAPRVRPTEWGQKQLAQAPA
jgi:two-component sensor histidine kinase